MTRLLALLFAGLGGAICSAAVPERPNIIFILADDLGLPALGCTGGVYKTPHLDALAQGGTRFENCFAAPLCGPTRALLMTGRYAFRTGVSDNGLGARATPEKDGCVALRMKQAGYVTAVAGKWRQLSHFTTREDAVKWGFDEFLIWGAGLPDDDEKQPKARQEKKTAKAAANSKNDRYWNPDYNLNGKTLKDAEGKYGPDVLNEFVVSFIQQHKQEPFFIYYPTPLIHGPILRTPDSQQPEAKGSHYADNIAYLDKLIGRIVAELETLKLRDKTLIVFTGDNGSVPVGTVGGRPVDGKKNTMLEGGSRVPLIANWPGAMPRGVVRKDPIDFTDLLPTFAELAGVKPTEGRVIDGHSFAPQLRGEQGQPREWAYVHLRNDRYVRSERWKLTGEGELFDMRDAPHRQVPVADDTKDGDAQAARAKLQKALDHLAAEAAKEGLPPGKKKGKKKSS